MAPSLLPVQIPSPTQLLMSTCFPSLLTSPSCAKLTDRHENYSQHQRLRVMCLNPCIPPAIWQQMKSWTPSSTNGRSLFTQRGVRRDVTTRSELGSCRSWLSSEGNWWTTSYWCLSPGEHICPWLLDWFCFMVLKPTTPSGHTQAPAYALAERGCAVIRKAWQ